MAKAALKWKKDPGIPGVQAPISHGGTAHDYVISHRPDQHTVSYRPEGKHEHVGTFSTEKAAKAAAAAYVPKTTPMPKMPKLPKTKPAQLEREIAESLRTSKQPKLAEMFADPEATKVFAREMRHELTKKQLAEKSAAGLAARPYTVKHLELTDTIGGKRRVRSFLGRYATKAEAQAKADAVDGWVEQEGRVIYGTEKQPDPAGES